uniref:Calpain catalytic domain-containing protein n=1 Tax=Labrus bergylta TaxID=56723 RepID=A0A3Q3EHY6_9LABR
MGMVVSYVGQSFSALRKQCQQKGVLFEDPLFPTTDQSLFYQSNRIGSVTWKRPKVREKQVFFNKFARL